MNDTVVPVKKGIASLTKMENSISATRMNGIVTERKTRPIRMRIAAMDMKFVTRKSRSVTSIRSFAITPSPVVSALGSYCLTMAFIASTCALHASEAASKEELTIIICSPSFSQTARI